MDPIAIRKTAITAMFSDETLLDLLVLKGGNALELVHGLGARASFDIDFSIRGDFGDLSEIEARIFRALDDRFDAVGMHVFDKRFSPKPAVRRPGLDDKWGGYRVEFKLISSTDLARLDGDIEALRRNAAVLSATHQRVFKIDISKHEYVDGKVERELDHFPIYVYSAEMMAAEKLRAICQQMPEYAMNPNGHPRARDFYDVHTIVTQMAVDLGSTSNLELMRAVFAAKDVPLRLLGRIHAYRDVHRPDWPSVVSSVWGTPEAFDFYFDFVLSEVTRLEPLWNE